MHFRTLSHRSPPNLTRAFNQPMRATTTTAPRSPAKHLTSWTDGRVTISGTSQQDAFTDSESTSSGGENIVLTGSAQTSGTKSKVFLNWSPAENDGTINVLRDGTVIANVPDSGSAKDKLKRASGTTHTYQVCETDGGGCSNEVQVPIP